MTTDTDAVCRRRAMRLLACIRVTDVKPRDAFDRIDHECNERGLIFEEIFGNWVLRRRNGDVVAYA